MASTSSARERGHGDAPTRVFHPPSRRAQPQWPWDTEPMHTGSHDQRPTDRREPGQSQPSSGGLSFPQGSGDRNREAEPRHKVWPGGQGRPPPLPAQK